MRTPKFKALDVHEKKMFTNAQLIIWNGNVYVNDNSKLNVDNLKGWNIDEKYLMQTTELKDIEVVGNIYENHELLGGRIEWKNLKLVTWKCNLKLANQLLKAC